MHRWYQTKKRLAYWNITKGGSTHVQKQVTAHIIAIPKAVSIKESAPHQSRLFFHACGRANRYGARCTRSAETEYKAEYIQLFAELQLLGNLI